MCDELLILEHSLNSFLLVADATLLPELPELCVRALALQTFTDIIVIAPQGLLLYPGVSFGADTNQPEPN